MKEEIILNIALGGGFAPLLIGFIASLIPSIRERMIEARQVITVFVAFCTLLFSVAILAQFHSLIDAIVVLFMTAAIVIAWMVRLGYWIPKAHSRSARPSRRSLFEKAFGYDTTARVAVFVAFIVIVIPVMIYGGAPIWIISSSPAWILGLMWAFEDVKIFK